MNTIKAVLFDLDGVLSDSVTWHRLALNKSLRRVAGFEIDFNSREGADVLVAPRTQDKLQVLLGKGRIDASQMEAILRVKKDCLDEVISEYACKDFLKIELLNNLRHRDIRTACVTNSNSVSAFAILESLGLVSCFDLIVTGSEVSHHKPSSEGYVTVMVKLGVLPKECVILEDSLEGITSARNTGAHVWIVSGPPEVTWENLNKFSKEITC